MGTQLFTKKTVSINNQPLLIYTYSNALTAARILLAPVIVVGILREWWVAVFLLFLIAALTDVLDGYLARLFNESSSLGEYLDPVADKILLFSSFAALAAGHSPSFPIPVWFVVVVLFRETVLLAGSCYCLKHRPQVPLGPTVWGKLTTLFQILFILWLFICHFCSWAPAKTYYVLLLLLALFSLLSCLHYLVRAAKMSMK